MRDLYFAYGSNLNRDDWCGEGRSNEMLRFRSIGYLPDHDLRFSHRSVRRQCGVLDIVPRIGQIVPGVIFEVIDDGWQTLDVKEGVRNGAYERIDTCAIDDRGQEVTVQTYRVANPGDFVKPSSNYVEIVRDGLESYELPTNALDSASRDSATRPLVDAFFVYGTLMRREPRFSALQKYGVRCTLLAKCPGRLLDLDEFPGLVDLDSDDSMVAGDFVRVRDPERAVAALDEIEGFNGFNRAGSLYRRTLCNVDVGDGRIRQAWTYCLASPDDRASTIPSGDWRQHCGKREQFLADLAHAHTGGNETQTALQIANTLPFSFNPDAEAVARSLMPLSSALMSGDVSERILAQQSGTWNALA